MEYLGECLYRIPRRTEDAGLCQGGELPHASGGAGWTNARNRSYIFSRVL
jgi:hypothetical protein